MTFSELADVAGPRVVAERLEGVGFDALHQVAVGGGEAGEEVLDQAEMSSLRSRRGGTQKWMTLRR